MDEDTIITAMERRRELRDRNVHDVVELLKRREELKGSTRWPTWWSTTSAGWSETAAPTQHEPRPGSGRGSWRPGASAQISQQLLSCGRPRNLASKNGSASAVWGRMPPTWSGATLVEKKTLAPLPHHDLAICLPTE